MHSLCSWGLFESCPCYNKISSDERFACQLKALLRYCALACVLPWYFKQESILYTHSSPVSAHWHLHGQVVCTLAGSLTVSSCQIVELLGRELQIRGSRRQPNSGDSKLFNACLHGPACCCHIIASSSQLFTWNWSGMTCSSLICS